MTEFPLLKPNGELYITVCKDGNKLLIKNIGEGNFSVNFDIKILDQLIEALQNIKFERWAEGDK